MWGNGSLKYLEKHNRSAALPYPHNFPQNSRKFLPKESVAIGPEDSLSLPIAINATMQRYPSVCTLRVKVVCWH